MLSKFKHNFKIFKKIDHIKNSLLKKKLNKLNNLLKIKLIKLNTFLKIKLIKLNFLSKKKKLTFKINNRASYFVLGVIFFILSYLSIPYFYNNDKLINKVESE